MLLSFVIPGMLVAEQVFYLEGGGYSFDGLSFVPGAATLMLPVAVLATSRPIVVPAVGTADPLPG